MEAFFIVSIIIDSNIQIGKEISFISSITAKEENNFKLFFFVMLIKLFCYIANIVFLEHILTNRIDYLKITRSLQNRDEKSPHPR